MLAIQYFIIILAVLVLARSILSLRRKKLALGSFFIILVLLIALVIIVFIPSIVVALSDFFGIERAKDFMIYAAILIIFFLIFRAYKKIESVERDITALVKKLSLSQLKQAI